MRLGKLELSASSVLERLGFPAARQWTPVGQLSGGERRRLQLTRLLMAEPNVLLLDEPTNDLDVDTLAQLEDLLDGWPGTLVVVSHDRYLVERVCDTVVALFGDGRITHLPGGIDEYLARRAAAGDAVAAAAARAPAATPRTSGDLGGGPARGPQGGAAAGAADGDAAAREEKLHTQLAEAATDPPGSWRWTPSCVRWWPSGSRWSWTGSRPRSSPSPDAPLDNAPWLRSAVQDRSGTALRLRSARGS